MVLRQSVRQGQISKGLQINIQPHIYKADPLVLAEWDQALKGFSQTLVDILVKHYPKVIQYEQELKNKMQSDMQHTISRAQLTSQDCLYIQRLRKEATDGAVAEAKKYSSEKAEQRRRSAETSRKRPRVDEEVETPKNFPGLLQEELEEFKAQIRATLPPQSRRGKGTTYPRARGHGRGRGRGRGSRSGESSAGRNTPRY